MMVHWILIFNFSVPASVACDSNPCQNDAECVSLYVAGEDGNKYKCICKSGTRGTHCETKTCFTGKNCQKCYYVRAFINAEAYKRLV